MNCLANLMSALCGFTGRDGSLEFTPGLGPADCNDMPGIQQAGRIRGTQQRERGCRSGAADAEVEAAAEAEVGGRAEEADADENDENVYFARPCIFSCTCCQNGQHEDGSSIDSGTDSGSSLLPAQAACAAALRLHVAAQTTLTPDMDSSLDPDLPDSMWPGTLSSCHCRVRLQLPQRKCQSGPPHSRDLRSVHPHPFIEQVNKSITQRAIRHPTLPSAAFSLDKRLLLPVMSSLHDGETLYEYSLSSNLECT